MAISPQNAYRIETVSKNWDNYVLCLKRASASKEMQTLVDKLGEAGLAVCPASTKADLVGSYVGGLVEHSLRTMTYMAKLTSVYGIKDQVDTATVIKVCLLHDIGKLGVPGVDAMPYYLESKDEWRRNKLGENYSINPDLQHLTVPTMTLMWCAKYGVELTPDEWHAVQSLGQHPGAFDRNDAPTKNETWVSHMLQQSVKASILKGRGAKEASQIG
jgi:hypothetical protein